MRWSGPSRDPRDRLMRAGRANTAAIPRRRARVRGALSIRPRAASAHTPASIGSLACSRHRPARYPPPSHRNATSSR
ncbi:unnamed protein product [Leptosia nina]|uniref:Uncharacterized protein n=1 Tax=Leptosia nina TaxID=320188 RepID=A0AAV1JD09_9NEOP